MGVEEGGDEERDDVCKERFLVYEVTNFLSGFVYRV